MNDIGFGLWMAVLGMGSVFLLLFGLMGLLRLIGWLDEAPWRRRAVTAGAAPQTAVAAAEAGPALPAAGTGARLSPQEAVAVAVAVAAYAEADVAGAAQQPVGGVASSHPWVVTTRGRQHDHYPRRR